MRTKVHTCRVQVDVQKYIRTEHPGGAVSLRPQPDGTKAATVELWIDLASLTLDLGARALRNKSGKAKLSGGDIEAVVVGTVERKGATP